MSRLIFLFITSLLLFSSCTFWQNKEVDHSQAIGGNWLILFPDHELTNEKQRQLYATMQDSIVGLLGLKTISFNNNGSFVQTDSILGTPGKWHFNSENNNLFIRDGGKGLDFFQGKLIGIEKDTMQIEELIPVDGEKIKLTWYLKRISDKKRSLLFDKEENWWRKNNSMENEQLKRKVKAMLDYYSLYYEMVSKESAYFSQSRVFLPFKYYQHSMGLKSFSEKSGFSQLFYNPEQASQAHAILAAAMEKLENERFPSGNDFVIEYSRFMKQLGDAIED